MATIALLLCLQSVLLPSSSKQIPVQTAFRTPIAFEYSIDPLGVQHCHCLQRLRLDTGRRMVLLYVFIIMVCRSLRVTIYIYIYVCFWRYRTRSNMMQSCFWAILHFHVSGGPPFGPAASEASEEQSRYCTKSTSPEKGHVRHSWHSGIYRTTLY